jgi:hypothetical protein
VSQLALAVEISKIDWDAAEKTFENLLWLESACSPGGRQLWDEVMGTAEYKHVIKRCNLGSNES